MWTCQHKVAEASCCRLEGLMGTVQSSTPSMSSSYQNKIRNTKWVGVLGGTGRAAADALVLAKLEHMDWPEQRADGSIVQQRKAFRDHEPPARSGCYLLCLLDLLRKLRHVGALRLLVTQHAGNWAPPMLAPEPVLPDDSGFTEFLAQRRRHPPLPAASSSSHTNDDDVLGVHLSARRGGSVGVDVLLCVSLQRAV